MKKVCKMRYIYIYIIYFFFILFCNAEFSGDCFSRRSL
jgi:hypothetical protein